MTEISIIPRSDSAVAATAALRFTGATVIENLLRSADVKALDGHLSAHLNAMRCCEGGFYGERTKRLGGLLKRSMLVADYIMHPVILAIANDILGPWCDAVQLNLAQAIEILPGALAQFPHRDQDMWRGDAGAIEYLINVMWPLTDFSEDNGATQIWLNSHGANIDVLPDETPPAIANCAPGSAIVFLGSTLHGAGPNVSNLPRRGLLISYALGWLKPYENPWLAYPPEIARDFTPELAALVGYRQHRPNLGNYEGQCPSILLKGSAPGKLHAIDALRPDQAQAVADFVHSQQTSGLPENRPTQ